MCDRDNIIKKLSIKQILYYNPFDKLYDLEEKGLDISFFYNNFFAYIKKYDEYYRFLKDSLTPDTENEKRILLLYSYSGNGKTTFLYWLKRKLNKENYFFEIINLIKNKTNQLYDSLKENQLIFQIIANDFLEILKKKQNSNSLQIIIDNPNLFYPSFANTIDKSLDLKSWDMLIEFRDEILKKKFVYENFFNLLHYLDFRQLLMLYFLEHIIDFAGKEDRVSYVFCFDNLDELSYEYLNEKLWDEFLEVYLKLSEITKDPAIKVNFDFNKLKLILVFREANIGKVSSQLNDRLEKIVLKKKILLLDGLEKVFDKRHELIKKYISDPKKHKTIELIGIIKGKECIYTKDIFLPLFNYDQRELLYALHELLTECDCGVERTFIDINKDEYNNISKYSPFGARGVIFNSLLKYFMYKNYLQNIISEPGPNYDTKKYGYCRTSRMLLTALSNLCYPNGFPIDRKALHEISPKPVSLSTFYKEIKELYYPDIFLSWLKKFFPLEKGSWAHFISIYNKNFSNIEIDFSKELAYLKNKEYENRLLVEIKLLFNASAFIYLRSLITHFEYYSTFIARKYRKPLFQSLFYNTESKKFEFEIVVSEVYDQVKKIKIENNRYLQKIIFNKLQWDLDSYCTSVFIFNRNCSYSSPLYMSRVISNHISYLDEFRYFLWNNKEFNSNIKSSGKSKRELQFFLIDYIYKYVNLILDQEHTKHIHDAMEKLKEKIDLIKSRKNKGKDPFFTDNREWIKIST